MNETITLCFQAIATRQGRKLDQGDLPGVGIGDEHPALLASGV